jgi:hypothetical protein
MFPPICVLTGCYHHCVKKYASWPPPVFCVLGQRTGCCTEHRCSGCSPKQAQSRAGTRTIYLIGRRSACAAPYAARGSAVLFRMILTRSNRWSFDCVKVGLVLHILLCIFYLLSLACCLITFAWFGVSERIFLPENKIRAPSTRWGSDTRCPLYGCRNMHVFRRRRLTACPIVPAWHLSYFFLHYGCATMYIIAYPEQKSIGFYYI